jgi:hypothetical protein
MEIGKTSTGTIMIVIHTQSYLFQRSTADPGATITGIRKNHPGVTIKVGWCRSLMGLGITSI